MKKMKIWALGMCMGLAALFAVPAGAEETEVETEAVSEAAEDDLQLSAPTDFQFDPETGEYSFTMTDERMGYYFIRLYTLVDGEEYGEYISTSSRINGSSTGEVTGTIDISGIPWGLYHVNLVSFAPAGTDYVRPEVQTITALCGNGLTLERPEFMVMTSGNSIEVIIDWYTLSDYYVYAYLPEMKITVYADAECTEEVMTDTVDLMELTETLSTLPPVSGYVWGFNMMDGEHVYTIEVESNGETSEVTFEFTDDCYEYTLDAGTYYVTCQAISKDEYLLDSQVSEVLEITVTDGESTSEYEYVQSEYWTDLLYMAGRPYATAGTQEDRVDLCSEQTATLELMD